MTTESQDIGLSSHPKDGVFYSIVSPSPEHTSFSDQHAHERTNGRKGICYLNNAVQDVKTITSRKHLCRAWQHHIVPGVW